MARAVVLAAMVTLAAISSLAVPRPAIACSCVGWQPLIGYAAEREMAVFVGRVGPTAERLPGLDPVDAKFRFIVERWFWGPDPAAVVAVASTGELGCGLELDGGEHLVAVATRREPGIWQPSICMPWADADSPEGQRLLAEASVTFGPGLTPNVPPDAQPVDIRPIVALGLVALVVGSVVLLARQRRRAD